MKLTKKFTEIMSNGVTRAKLAVELEVDPLTINRWVNAKKPSDNLTKLKVINAIKKVTGLEVREIFEEEDLKQVYDNI